VDRRVFEWDVVRTGETVRVDLTKASDVTEADTDAIVAAVEKLLVHPEVAAVKLDGPVLVQQGPPDGLNNAIRSLAALAKKHGKRFVVGPI
jgi:hypothetical protein